MKPRGLESPVLDRIPHSAAGLALVLAIAKPALSRQGLNVLEGIRNAGRGICQLQFPHARCVQHQAAARDQVKLATGRSMASLRVVFADGLRRDRVAAGECVGQGRFPDTGRPEERDRPDWPALGR